MRIPSDFNGENLYRHRNEPKDGDLGLANSQRSPISRRLGRLERTSATRRLLRLVVGLVLVIVLMRHAARPEIYRVFFVEPMQKVPAISDGGPPVAPGLLDQTSSIATTSVERTAGNLYSRSSPHFRDAVRVLEQLPMEQSRAILSVSPNTMQAEMVGPLAQGIKQAVDKLAESLEPLEVPSSEWFTLAEQLQQSPQAFASKEADATSQLLFAAIRLAALDSALGRVVDGSIWRSGDLDAFYGAMVQRDLIASIEHVRTGVLPMLQQPEVYRGKGVTVVGKVVRGEQLDATANVMGIAKYWQLWLRPADGSERPIVAVVAELPAELAAKLTPENDPELIPLSEASQVQIDGVYLKRLAYRSSEGAELAPVVVGFVAAMSGLAATRAVGATNAEPAATVDGSSLLMLTLTAVLGFAIAAVVMIRTQRENARLRLIRSQQQSETISLPHLLVQANDAEKNTQENADHD